MPSDAVVKAVPDSEGDTDATVRYSDLPDDEKETVETAVNEGLYHVCPEIPDAVGTFAGRFSETEEPALSYDGTTYGLWIRVEDETFAMTAPPPENGPSCGVL